MFKSLIRRWTKCRKDQHDPAYYEFVTSWMDGGKQIHVKNEVKASCVHCKYHGSTISATEKLLEAKDVNIEMWGRMANGVVISGWWLNDCEGNRLASAVTSSDRYGGC